MKAIHTEVCWFWLVWLVLVFNQLWESMLHGLMVIFILLHVDCNSWNDSHQEGCAWKGTMTMWKWCSQAQMIIILLCPKPVVHLASHLTLYRRLPRTQEHECGCGTHAVKMDQTALQNLVVDVLMTLCCTSQLDLCTRGVISEGGMEWLARTSIALLSLLKSGCVSYVNATSDTSALN